MCLNDNINLVKAARIVNDMPVNKDVKREVLKRIVNDETDADFVRIDATTLTVPARRNKVVIDKVNRVLDVVDADVEVRHTRMPTVFPEDVLNVKEIEWDRKRLPVDAEIFIYDKNQSILTTPDKIHTYTGGSGRGIVTTDTAQALKPGNNFLLLIAIAAGIYFFTK